MKSEELPRSLVLKKIYTQFCRTNKFVLSKEITDESLDMVTAFRGQAHSLVRVILFHRLVEITRNVLAVIDYIFKLDLSCKI